LIGGSFGLVTLSNANGAVTGTSNSYLGGLLGVNAGAIAQSYATGKVTGSGTGNFVGGLTGASFAWGPLSKGIGSGTSPASATAGASFASTITTPTETGTILQSYATGAVSSGANSYVGGLAGASLGLTPADAATASSPSIIQAYAIGSVAGGANSHVAGLVALNTGTIDQTYAAGPVSGGAGSVLGGLLAQNSLSATTSLLPTYPSPLRTCNECAAFVQAPLAGTGTVINSYWDFQTTGQLSSAAGIAQTSAQLTSGLPLGFDQTTWLINVGASFPYLGPPLAAPVPLPVPGPTAPSPLTPPPVTPLSQFVQQLANNQSLTPPSTGPVVDTQLLTQQQQRQQQQQQQQRQGNGPPGQLDAGPGRFFFIPPPGETRFVSDQLVLQIDSNIPLAQVQQIAAQLGLTIISSQSIGLLGQTVYEFRINNGSSVADIIRHAVDFRIITGAAPQYLYTLTQDTAAHEGDPGQYVLDKLKLPDVHRALRGDNVEIAVIDSQIDAAHPDLAGVVTESYDAAGVEEKPHPHGTGMAGAIAAHERLVGVAPNAHLLAIHAFSVKAATSESTTFIILKGLDHAVAHGVRLVNMSFSGPRDPTLERAIKAAYERNVIMIAAAGNAGPKSPPLYPAADPNVIAVTATDMNDNLFSGANRGRYIAIAAPGVDILVPAPDGTYQLTTGTSVATAHISGIVALMLERNPKLSPADVRRILVASAKRLGPNDQFGAGLVDPSKALQLAAPKSAELVGPLSSHAALLCSEPIGPAVGDVDCPETMLRVTNRRGRSVLSAVAGAQLPAN
jgi:hypothetical protein